MPGRSLRLSTRLGLSHGTLVVLLVVLLAVTLQGLVRMLALVVEIRDTRLPTVDAEEELHRAAWKIEVAMRHGRAACVVSDNDPAVRTSLLGTGDELAAVLARRGAEAPERLRAATQRYVAIANAALEEDTCAFLVSPRADTERAKLDEELTDAWIDRLQELHSDIQKKEDAARRIGTSTTIGGIAVALIAAAVALAIARSTSRSVSEPIRRLAGSATRLGAGDFSPIPAESGPREVEDLWREFERAREALLELDQLKQSFLASISHELRSPLTSVREALCLLADGTAGELTPKQTRIVELGLRACEREVRIVEALLVVSRLRSGGSIKREAACDIAAIVSAAIDGERDDANRQGVTIDVETREPTPLLEIDSALVERAVANLLRNAVSVSKPGQRIRIVRGVAEKNEVATVAVDVIDEGPGLAEELRGVLFRPFATAPVSGVGRPPGIGLGLSFAREIARAHGGDLTVPQSDERGTIFRLELPLLPSET